MVLGCLVGYIGLRGCGATAPRSGAYINSMAGISLEMLEKLTKEEANTFKLLWDDIEQRAIAKLSIEAKARLARRFKINTLLKSVDLEKDIDLTSQSLAAAKYRGIYIDSEYISDKSNVKRSALSNIYIQTILFYSPINQDPTTIKVFDAYTGEILLTKTFAAVIGWNTINIDTQFNARSIFACIDSTNIASFEKLLPSTTQLHYTNIRGGELTIGSDIADIDTGNNTFGMSLTFSVRCSFDAAICNNIDLFSLPLSYLLASEIMLERLASSRMNQFTMDREQAKEMKDHYDVEFEKAIGSVIDSIDLDQDDECVVCNDMFRITENHL